MFKNYFKTALRNFLREKSSSLLNISGLTLGITCSLVLFLMVKHLASFDNYHVNRDRIYRVVTESDGNNGKFYTPGVPTALPDAFLQDFPECEQVTFASYRAGALIKVPQKNGETTKYQEEAGIVFAQPGFFKIFDRPLVVGSVEKGLDDPNEAIISRSLAKKYFGKEEVVGEVVKYDTIEYRITAVMEDFPANTDFPFNLMLSYATIKKDREASGWRGIWSDEQCYILVKEKSISAIESRMPAFVEKYLGKENYSHQTFTLQPLSQLHVDDRYSNFNYKTAPREMIVALAIIAAFLIITACINFINLTTAEAIKRSKEVGIRKSLGSTRSQLILQFLGETTLVTFFAMLLSLGFTEMSLSLLNPFLNLKLGLYFSSDVHLWAFIIGVTVGVSLLSGFYPSLIISGYKPVLALKNQISNKSASGFNLRRSLVVLQFVISQFFIMGTIILVSQMNYFQTQDLGFRKDAVLMIPIPENESAGPDDGVSKMRTLREEISRFSGVEFASLSSTPPSSGSVRGTGFYFEGQDESEKRDTQVKQVDGHYISLYNIALVAGANIEDYDTARGFVVNEELVRIAGVQNPQDIIGKRMKMWGRNLPIVGVVKNFHTVSLHQPLEPTVLMNDIGGYRTLSLKINQSQLKSIISDVKTKWEAAYPEHIFDYQFLDEHIREFYEGEQKMSILLTVFTSMAIFIGCLGLFGLATFMANQKTKEIGVRKAMGASVESIVLLFSKEYVKLIVIGFLLAAPFVWFLMNKWLEGFAYKITIGPAVFIIGLAITLVIAVLTVGYRSFKAAIVNPIKSLRYE
ncbi:MAG: ABC transporter permease [Cyclobacteriaceae bacterium]